MSDPDFLSLPSDWRERALATMRGKDRELLELSWELAWREGWAQCARLALEKIKQPEKA